MLYICGTPIGNLRDASFRLIETLNSVDIILCEDTRVSVKLLNHYNIKKKLISYHKHNEKSMQHKIIGWLSEGKNIALISDAGMPCVSDPGADLVKLCEQKDFEYTSVPSATAFTTAISLAGIEPPYAFLGFLPTKQKEITELLEKQTSDFIIYEAPHKLIKTLSNIKKVLGDREVIIARELTKKFEETKRGRISELIEYFKEPKGEFVVIVKHEVDEQEFEYITIAKKYIDAGFSKKEATKIVAIQTGTPRNKIYNLIMQI